HPIALHHSVPISKPRPFSVRAPFSTTTQRCQFTPSIKTANMSDYETILKGKYPAKDHAKRVADHIRSKIPGANGILYLEGRHTKLEEDSDHPEPFRQRRYFFYLTGCILADCHYIFDLKTSQSTLFIPPVDPEDVIWSGMPMTAEEAKEKYDVDNVLYTNDVNAELARLGKGSGSTAFAIANQVLDTVSFIEFEDKNFDVLKGAIEECRVVKDDYEVALTRKANAISTTAHHAVMKAVSKAKNEQELEAIFLERCFAHGARGETGSPAPAEGGARGQERGNDKKQQQQGKKNKQGGRNEWRRQMNDKRKQLGDARQAKRRKLDENGNTVDADNETEEAVVVDPRKANPFSTTEIAAEERRPKRKVAVMVGYSGTGYYGLQINWDEKTIEGDLFKAFIAAVVDNKGEEQSDDDEPSEEDSGSSAELNSGDESKFEKGRPRGKKHEDKDEKKEHKQAVKEAKREKRKEKIPKAVKKKMVAASSRKHK
ncbi:hypothetical protein BN1723_012533, partial [Verticillium longisporum]